LGRCFKAGAAKAVISPPVGFGLAGCDNRIEGSIGIHDDLYAKALVLDDGIEKAAIVACDLIGVSKEIVSKVRQDVEADLGIKGSNVMVTATHTHTGPDFGHSNGEYLNELTKEITGSIRAAYYNLAEARIGAGEGEALIGYNRRNPKFNYFLRPYPEGARDSEVGVLRVDDKEGNVIATVINAPCHGVVLGSTCLLISADYPVYATKIVEIMMGGVAIFLNGCCGNINPVNTWGPYTVIKGKIVTGRRVFQEAERLGNILGGEALKVMEQIETTPEVKLKVKRAEALLPTRKDVLEKLVKRIQNIKPDHPRYEFYQRILKGEGILTEVQAIALDDIVIVGLPGEVFVEFGLEIKKKSPFRHTIISELANESIGYIPTAKAFKEGGYDVVTSVMTPESGAKLVQASVDLLKEL